MDLMCAKVLIKRNGMLAGDDYNWPEVKKAVDELCDEIGKKVKIPARDGSYAHSRRRESANSSNRSPFKNSVSSWAKS